MRYFETCQLQPRLADPMARILLHDTVAHCEWRILSNAKDQTEC